MLGAAERASHHGAHVVASYKRVLTTRPTTQLLGVKRNENIRLHKDLVLSAVALFTIEPTGVSRLPQPVSEEPVGHLLKGLLLGNANACASERAPAQRDLGITVTREGSWTRGCISQESIYKTLWKDKTLPMEADSACPQLHVLGAMHHTGMEGNTLWGGGWKWSVVSRGGSFTTAYLS